jgi:hypothetical protein
VESCILLPLTKSPHTKGRIGPHTWQDWYRSLVKTKRISPFFRPYEVLILSNFQVAGSAHEVDLYLEACRNLGIDNLLPVREAYETMGQLDYAFARAAREKKRLVVISTWFHFPRVWWLCRGHSVKHVVAYGIPRPFGAITDIVLTFVFPILDILGMRKWFKDRLDSRRVGGKL